MAANFGTIGSHSPAFALSPRVISGLLLIAIRACTNALACQLAVPSVRPAHVKKLLAQSSSNLL